MGQLEEVTIAVMGATGTGKSTFINLISGSTFEVGNSLKSCTADVNVSPAFELAGRRVRLVDTPGFDDTTISDTEILKMIAQYMSTTYESGHKLSGVIYMHRISDFRMTGISVRNFGMFRRLCGENALKNVVIVTNMWGEVPSERGAARERELATDNKLFRPVLDKGAKMLRHDNTLHSGQSILMNLVQNTPEALQIQREMVHEKKDVSQTAAGITIAQETAELERKHREEMERQQRAIAEALAAQEAERQRQIEAARQEHLAHLERVRQEEERLARERAEAQRIAEEQRQAAERAFRAAEEARAQQQLEQQRIQQEMEAQAQAAAIAQENLRQQIAHAQALRRHHGGGGGGCVIA